MTMPGFQHADPLTRHIDLVNTVTDGTGIEPPATWTQLLARYLDFCNLATPVRDELTHALITGTEANIPLLKAAVTAEMLGQSGNQALGTIRASINAELRALHKTVADDVYSQIKALYDTTAARFVDVANTADIAANPLDVLDWDDDARAAYKAAEAYSTGVERLLPALASSATLCSGRDFDPSDDPLMIPLCCAVDGHSRRTVWTAWETSGGRCGRWEALAAAGIGIRAHDDPANLVEVERAGSKQINEADTIAPVEPINPRRLSTA